MEKENWWDFCEVCGKELHKPYMSLPCMGKFMSNLCRECYRSIPEKDRD